jgi:uncharacterized protein (DUF433 family)
MYRGEPYEYYPLGKYIVAAPQVSGGKPTFKYTRIRVEVVLALITSGWTISEVVEEYKASKLSKEAVQEALRIATKAFIKASAPTQAAV